VTTPERLQFFAPCPAGVEPLLADELRSMRLRGVRPQRSGVLFSGRLIDGYRALLWTRLATRVLLTLGEVGASSADTLYDGIRAMPWEDHVSPTGTIAIDAAGVNDALRNTQFTAVRTKDAIADRLREASGERPSVDTARPDVRVNVAVRRERATVSLDLAGLPLHRRGYRAHGVQVEAPMKETLAAAVLAYAGWGEIAAAGGALADPLCGSGTLAIEAALGAGDVAPGLLRPEHPVERWLGHDPEAWQRLIVEATRRREAGRDGIPPIVASDSDARAVDVARDCVRRAGLEGSLEVLRRDLTHAEPPASLAPGAPPGLIATNPPWGLRLSQPGELLALYTRLSTVARQRFSGWRLAVVSPDPGLSGGLRLTPQRSAELGTGKGATRVTVFEVPSPPSGRAGAATGAGMTDVLPAPRAADPSTAAFENRLRKMAKHYGTWARRTGVGCYRVYDADLPDYAVAVDIYNGAGPDTDRRWVHIAEYSPPPGIDPSKASARLADVLDAVPPILDVHPSSAFLKRRERQRGSAQYARVSAKGVTGIVGEAGLLFEVNFTDYLDTGLFLDHRDTRAWIGELAEGMRFLNLFAYTGAATVHAAAGRAASTTTVDLSANYLEWAERNMLRNGFSDSRHQREQADVLLWLRKAKTAGREFDLVFCDPPTFSNSKRMRDTWDVERDHVTLLTAIERVLAADGQILFSTNKRRFELDTESLERSGLSANDVTARTIPRDFERHGVPHRSWVVRRREDV
jgi:23S rRNA (guanine2445-N2)-methyltransferase / 23S rRNA (guanine2069-N7)-methyltransferase